MSPNDFEDLAKGAFDIIKTSLGTKVLEATYKPKQGGAFKLRGVFDDRAQEIDPDTEQHVSSNVFTFGIKLDDIPNLPVKGDKVVIKNQLYRVIEALEDGVPGVSTVLVLHRIES